MNFSIVAACKSDDGGIGFNNTIPWRLKADMQHFKNLTTKVVDSNKVNAVIMGKNTWHSLPQAPLSNRLNIIISSTMPSAQGAFVFQTLQSSLDFLEKESDLIETAFVIGGQRLYEEAIRHPRASKIYLTRVFTGELDIQCDTYFPMAALPSFSTHQVLQELTAENNLSYTISVFGN